MRYEFRPNAIFWMVFAAFVTLVCLASMATAQTIDVDEAVVTVGEVGATSISGAQQTVSGITLVQTSPARTSARVETVPDVAAPSIVGGNPCSTAVSLGGSVLGFGIAGGLSVEDDNCQTRQETALLANMGQKPMALYHMCSQVKDVAASVAGLGMDCAGFAKLAGTGGDVIAATPTARPVMVVPVSMSVAADCTRGDYYKLMRSGKAWDEWSPECQARHTAGG